MTELTAVSTTVSTTPAVPDHDQAKSAFVWSQLCCLSSRKPHALILSTQDQQMGPPFMCMDETTSLYEMGDTNTNNHLSSNSSSSVFDCDRVSGFMKLRQVQACYAQLDSCQSRKDTRSGKNGKSSHESFSVETSDMESKNLPESKTEIKSEIKSGIRSDIQLEIKATKLDSKLDSKSECEVQVKSKPKTKPKTIVPDVSQVLLTKEYLHVIIVISNPCEYKRRWQLAEQFVEQMKWYEDDMKLYVVELCYGNQTFHITQSNNPRHLQLRTDTPLWHKESMINVGVTKLLPPNWKYMAWIDADIVFDNAHWVVDTLQILNSGVYDVVQLFSHCLDLNAKGEVMTIFQSAGFQHVHHMPNMAQNLLNYYHPGFAWAITRSAYDRLGGLLDKAILGSADDHMCKAWLHNAKLKSSAPPNIHANYHRMIYEFQKRCVSIRLGYVPGVISHLFHGKKMNRKYNERWHYLIEHQFDPDTHLIKNEDGLVVCHPTEFPIGLKQDIMTYFQQRNEDEYVA